MLNVFLWKNDEQFLLSLGFAAFVYYIVSLPEQIRDSGL